jgi:prepilin-type N-terminal cleavage/methylation domain-containing protein
MMFLFVKKKQGFTLAELLVVIAVIAITATIAAPLYRSISINLNLNAAARDLATDLHYAQQLAVTTQVSYQVIFHVALSDYDIKNSESGEIIRTKTIKEPITILSVISLLDDTVSFNATGAANASGTVTLIAPDNRQTSVEIKPSGYVKLQ